MTACGEAFYYGLLAGAVLGGVAACALCWRSLRIGCDFALENAKMRSLLYDLQNAERMYRQQADTLGENHPDTTKAWDEMRTAGAAARVHLFHAERE